MAIPGDDEAAYTSPIVVTVGGQKQYVQSLSKGLVGLDAKTGKFLWRYAEVAKGPAQYFTPVARGEYVYGGALSVGGGMVHLKADGTAEQVYFARGLPNGPGGALVVGDTLYGTEVGGSFLAVEFTTGKVKWKAEAGGRGSLAYADGLLYFHNENGDIALIEDTPAGFREKSRFTPPNKPQAKKVGQFGEGAYCYPVIANGRLYIRDLTALWVYDIKNK